MTGWKSLSKLSFNSKTMKKTIISIIIILFALPMSVVSVGGQTAIQQRCVHGTFKHQGLSREYYLYTPAGLKEGAPLVLCLHGYGGFAANGKVMVDLPQMVKLSLWKPLTGMVSRFATQMEV